MRISEYSVRLCIVSYSASISDESACVNGDVQLSPSRKSTTLVCSTVMTVIAFTPEERSDVRRLENETIDASVVRSNFWKKNDLRWMMAAVDNTAK